MDRMEATKMKQPSPRIMNGAQNVTIINLQSWTQTINDELYLTIAADVAGSKGGVYRVLIYRSKTSGRDWSSCNCTGFFFHFICKHVWAVEMKQHNQRSVDYANNSKAKATSNSKT